MKNIPKIAKQDVDEALKYIDEPAFLSTIKVPSTSLYQKTESDIRQNM